MATPNTKCWAVCTSSSKPPSRSLASRSTRSSSTPVLNTVVAKRVARNTSQPRLRSVPVVALLLIRHAKAGSRREWLGDDQLRPVSHTGATQAESLIPLLAPFGVRRVLSSPFVRCVQTVEPLARAAGIEVEVVEELAEGRAGKAVAL